MEGASRLSSQEKADLSGEESDEENENETENDFNYKSVPTFNLISTNARSLTPKIESLVEYLNELEASIAFLTETWFSDSPELELDIADFEKGTGYSILCKNRPVNCRGYSTGGVAIAFRTSHVSFSKIELPGNEFEILFAVGTMPRFTRKFIAVCIYMPPSMSAASASACLELSLIHI